MCNKYFYIKMTTALDELSLRELYVRKEYLLKQIKRVDLEIEKRLYEEGEIENNINHDTKYNTNQNNCIIKEELEQLEQKQEEILEPKKIKISKKAINNEIKDISNPMFTPISTAISTEKSSNTPTSTPKIMKITIKKSLVKELS